MNYKLLKYSGYTTLIIVSLLTANIAGAAPGAQVKLAGQNDALLDRPAIQAAIDSAPGQRLTIKLRGTFQLDGHDLIVDRSDLVIKGDRGGATLLGKLGSDGLPIDDINNFPNRGFLIESVDPLTNIEIKDLGLSGFRTAVFIKGQLNEISDVQVKNNHVENSLFAVTAIGAVSDIMIANNTAIGLSNAGITVFGTVEGQPTGLQIVDNHISEVLEGLFIRDVSDAIIANNYSEGQIDGLYILDISNAIIANNYLSTYSPAASATPFLAGGTNTGILVESNTTQGGAIGMLFFDDATDFIITRNCVRNGGTEGIPFFRSGGIRVGFDPFGLTGSGFEIMNNSYSGNVAGDPGVPSDVWLDVGSSNNFVAERASAVVLDEGASNSVEVLPEDGVNHCDD